MLFTTSPSSLREVRQKSKEERKGEKKLRKKGGQDKTLESRLEGKRKM